jgi:uncharacterized protein (DUF1800 family)
MQLKRHAANRFGLGPRPGELDAIGDPRDWLLGQLRPASALLEGEGLPTQQVAADALDSLQRELRERQASGEPPPSEEERRARSREDAMNGSGTARGIVATEYRAAIDRRLTTGTPFIERLVAFWSNHLCVSPAGKIRLLTFPGLYDREVIRPHVLGRYRDMVLASARHPAMLLYLDNMQSIGPRSQAAERMASFDRGRERGLNENYARELLELHTLGVEGGYTQQDVEQLARILTGWTLQGLPIAEAAAARARQGSGPGGRFRSRMMEQGLRRAGFSRDAPFGFSFRPELHEPGSKTVLGRKYGEGESAGREVITDLCRHPSTARFLATKLVRHFVADEPPAGAVDAIATVFAETDGDLLEVSRALVALPAAWETGNRKFRTPQDWLVASGRALGVNTLPQRVGFVLRELRHPLWSPPSPKGFDDQMGPWADPDSLLNRAEFARTVASAVSRGGTDPAHLLDVTGLDANEALAALVSDRSIPSAERVALLIGGPDFQWR